MAQVLGTGFGNRKILCAPLGLRHGPCRSSKGPLGWYESSIWATEEEVLIWTRLGRRVTLAVWQGAQGGLGLA
ncbi:hypothetical protein PRUPE_3G128500 [Prunus persica]|uniref:Uncharacterized protein n=1 Tax=Prunus persica TaxID=3760 RepID=M5X8X1_PRUPE|nr:hypothetical protein PRUPE_3G128500 [Prunus persica]